MSQAKTKILFLTSEISPFCETYKLSDFSKKISMLLNDKENYDIRISQPKYGFISERKYILREVIRLKEVPVNFNDSKRILSIKSAFIPGTRVQVYFVLDKDYFANTNPLIYKSKNGQFIKDNFQRYSLFCLTLLESFKKLFWYPDIIITNDWQTSMLPLILKNKYNEDENYKKIKTLNFIHSLDNNRKIQSNYYENFGINVKYKKGMDVLSESLSHFNMNVLLDVDNKTLSKKISKSKIFSENFKKAKTRSWKFPEENQDWLKLVEKIDSLILKL